MSILIFSPFANFGNQSLNAQIVCPSPKVWNFDEKRLHWASVVRAIDHAPDMIGKEKLFTSK